MADIKGSFDVLDEVPTPDLRSEIEARELRGPMFQPLSSVRRRRYHQQLENDLREARGRERWSKRKDASLVRPQGRNAPWGRIAAGFIVVVISAGIVGLALGGGGYKHATSGLGYAPNNQVGGISGRPQDLLANPKQGVETAPAQASRFGVPAASPTSVVHAGAQQPSGPQVDLSKIVRDGTISIVVPKKGFGTAFAKTSDIAAQFHGFVLSSTIANSVTGTLTLRIPSRNFDKAMLALANIGSVEHQTITGKDVTAQFIDLHARLKVAQAHRAVLFRLLTKATTIGETISLQNQIDQIQLSIEEFQGQLNVINNQVSESTIQVTLREQGTAAPVTTSTDVKNPSLSTAWNRGVQGFLRVIGAVVVGLGYVLPATVIVLLLAFAFRLAQRRRETA